LITNTCKKLNRIKDYEANKELSENWKALLTKKLGEKVKT